MNRGLVCLLLAASVHAVLLWPRQASKARLSFQGGSEKTVDLIPLTPSAGALAAPRTLAPSEKSATPPGPESSGEAPTPILPFSRVLALGNEAPAYPDRAVENGWEGDVDLRLQVSATGEVEDAAVEHPSGFLVLDDAARRAALRWKLPPGPKGYHVRVEFRLR